MSNVQTPLFCGSQWHKAYNSAESNIPPYGVAEAYGVASIVVNNLVEPAVNFIEPSEDNPDRVAFTGPTGLIASRTGICHFENTGYAAHTGTLDLGTKYGVASGSYLLEPDVDGAFFPVGGTFVSAGNNVSLFLRDVTGSGGGGGSPSSSCDTVRFTIIEVDITTDPYSASATVAARPCGCDEVPLETDGEIIVFDALECLLYDEDPIDYEGRKGFASYMKVPGEDKNTERAWNFRETMGFVSDTPPEQYTAKSAWSVSSDAEDEDVSAVIDRRLAGNVHPVGDEDDITFSITLPSVGRYRIRLAAGDYADTSTIGLKIYDNLDELVSLSGSVASGSFMDASGATHAAADWPDDNIAIEEDFITTTLRVVLSGELSKLAHFYIMRINPCRWEITALCCPENII